MGAKLTPLRKKKTKKKNTLTTDRVKKEENFKWVVTMQTRDFLKNVRLEFSVRPY